MVIELLVLVVFVLLVIIINMLKFKKKVGDIVRVSIFSDMPDLIRAYLPDSWDVVDFVDCDIIIYDFNKDGVIDEVSSNYEYHKDDKLVVGVGKVRFTERVVLGIDISCKKLINLEDKIVKRLRK